MPRAIKLVQLICGHSYFEDGYPYERDELKDHPEVLEQMNADYFRSRDRILNDQMAQIQSQRGNPIWAQEMFEPKQVHYQPGYETR